jgi:hypothetical protein
MSELAAFGMAVITGVGLLAGLGLVLAMLWGIGEAVGVTR